MSPVTSPPAHRALRAILSSLFTLCLVATFTVAGAPHARAGGPAIQVGDELAAARPKLVDVALILAADVSQSMDDGELALQRKGYSEALRSEEVISAIRYGRHKRIAIAYFEWGTPNQQVLVAPWTIIDGADAAERLAAVIANAPGNSLERTGIGAALNYAGTLFDESGLIADRRVIDISGDGLSNIGPAVGPSRDALVEKGVTINALPIMPRPGEWSFNMPSLDAYYEQCVIGGAGAFSLPTESMEAFSTALKSKLILEIAGIPQVEPRIMPAAAPKPVNCNWPD